MTKSEQLELGKILWDITEQQRIAACLTTLDTHLTAQAEQIESLKAHKRGPMQHFLRRWRAV